MTETPNRILIAEDDSLLAAALADACEAIGHAALTVPTGTEAVDRCAAFGPRVAFLDLGLPGLGGIEAGRRIRASAAGQRLYLVALTGHTAPHVHKAAMEAGFDLVLTKPIALGAIEALLERVCR